MRPEYTFVCATSVYKCDVIVVSIIYVYMYTFIYIKKKREIEREGGDIVFGVLYLGQGRGGS